MLRVVSVFRSRRSEALIQQMNWKVNYSDVVFINIVCITLLLVSGLAVYVLSAFHDWRCVSCIRCMHI